MAVASRRAFLKTGVAATALTSASKGFSANDEIVLGLIGSGGRGQRLLRAITNIEGFRVAATCDLIEDRAIRAAEICEQYTPAPRVYTDLNEMLDAETLDACIVATQEGFHAQCAIPVLERDIHCFLEKPLDISVRNVERLTRVARRSNGLLQVGFQRHYALTFRRGIRHIQAGKLGKVTFLQGKWHWNYGVPNPRHTDMEVAGGWFLAQACHHMDVMMWVMNYQAPLRCAAMGAITDEYDNPPRHTAEDRSALIYEFPGGVTFSYSHVMNCPDAFTGEQLWVYGEKGGIDLPKGVLYPTAGHGAEPVQLAEPTSDWDEGTYEQLIAFGQHIRNNETPWCDIERARMSTLAGLMGQYAMYDSRRREFGLSALDWNRFMRMA